MFLQKGILWFWCLIIWSHLALLASPIIVRPDTIKMQQKETPHQVLFFFFFWVEWSYIPMDESKLSETYAGHDPY